MSTFGLVLIVLTVLVFVVLLVDDGCRWLRGQVTFSEWASERTYRKAMFVAGAAVLPVGMILHLAF